MMDPTSLAADQLSRYLQDRHGAPVEIETIRELGGENTGAEALKQFGYGRPILVTYRAGEQRLQEVFHSIRGNEFGRERQDDRVAAVWLDFNTFNKLPRHVEAVDMIGFTKEGSLRSLADVDEVMLVTTYRPGTTYAEDLLRVRDEGQARPADLHRAEALATYLAAIHQNKHDDPALWRRRLRDLVGHGEGIMGLTDSYPDVLPYVTPAELWAIEERANRWRWRLKSESERLRQVHGDFHPFNIIFSGDLEFYVLDRSRGPWGEPADDVSCLTINYLFFSLQRSGRLESPFRELHDGVWERYFALRPDEGLLSAIQPWFAWRALVLASPLWYPNIDDDVRRKLLTFTRRVLETKQYDYEAVNRYLEAE
jgi:hypothetical protein